MINWSEVFQEELLSPVRDLQAASSGETWLVAWLAFARQITETTETTRDELALEKAEQLLIEAEGKLTQIGRIVADALDTYCFGKSLQHRADPWEVARNACIENAGDAR